jgi:hypothetical protein
MGLIARSLGRQDRGILRQFEGGDHEKLDGSFFALQVQAKLADKRLAKYGPLGKE